MSRKGCAGEPLHNVPQIVREDGPADFERQSLASSRPPSQGYGVTRLRQPSEDLLACRVNQTPGMVTVQEQEVESVFDPTSDPVLQVWRPAAPDQVPQQDNMSSFAVQPAQPVLYQVPHQMQQASGVLVRPVPDVASLGMVTALFSTKGTVLTAVLLPVAPPFEETALLVMASAREAQTVVVHFQGSTLHSCHFCMEMAAPAVTAAVLAQQAAALGQHNQAIMDPQPPPSLVMPIVQNPFPNGPSLVAGPNPFAATSCIDNAAALNAQLAMMPSGMPPQMRHPFNQLTNNMLPMPVLAPSPNTVMLMPSPSGVVWVPQAPPYLPHGGFAAQPQHFYRAQGRGLRPQTSYGMECDGNARTRRRAARVGKQEEYCARQQGLPILPAPDGVTAEGYGDSENVGPGGSGQQVM